MLLPTSTEVFRCPPSVSCGDGTPCLAPPPNTGGGCRRDTSRKTAGPSRSSPKERLARRRARLTNSGTVCPTDKIFPQREPPAVAPLSIPASTRRSRPSRAQRAKDFLSHFRKIPLALPEVPCQCSFDIADHHIRANTSVILALPRPATETPSIHLRLWLRHGVPKDTRLATLFNITTWSISLKIHGQEAAR